MLNKGLACLPVGQNSVATYFLLFKNQDSCCTCSFVCMQFNFHEEHPTQTHFISPIRMATIQRLIVPLCSWQELGTAVLGRAQNGSPSDSMLATFSKAQICFPFELPRSLLGINLLGRNTSTNRKLTQAQWITTSRSARAGMAAGQDPQVHQWEPPRTHGEPQDRKELCQAGRENEQASASHATPYRSRPDRWPWLRRKTKGNQGAESIWVHDIFRKEVRKQEFILIWVLFIYRVTQRAWVTPLPLSLHIYTHTYV